MSDISARDVKELRQRTGAGMMACKQALKEAGGGLEEAAKLLRQKGLSEAEKRSGRAADEGIVDSYIHQGGRVGVLVEVNCETDSAARTDRFKAFVHDVALQIAAGKPLYLSADDVPEELKQAEREVYLAQSEGIDERFRDKAVQGKLAKRLKEICLLDQEFVLDQAQRTSRTMEELRAEAASELGENVTIRRFALFELGQ